MWPNPTHNRLASWDHYYGHSASTAADEQRRATITSGIAAGLTLIVFFAIFLITLGWRFCNSHSQRQHQQQCVVDSLSFVCQPPLPSYESALHLPAFPLSSLTPAPHIDAPFRVPKSPKSQTEGRN